MTMRSAHKSMAELREEKYQIEEESNRVLRGFLMVDLDLALTFAQTALLPECSPERKVRNQANARRGYDVVMWYLNDKGVGTSADWKAFQQKINDLRAHLQRLGEVFPG